MSNIIVFHGDNIALSRQAFLDKIKQYDTNKVEIIRIDGKNLDENFIQSSINSPSMFQNTRLIILENLFSLPKSDNKDKIIKRLCQTADIPIIVWEGKEIDTKGYTENVVFQRFKLPNELFTLLDQLDSNNIKKSIVMLDRVKDQVDDNYLFLMFARQIRLLILAKAGETTTLAPWQSVKLKKQAENFTVQQLIDVYHQLRDIDYRQKTSQSTTGYLGEIEFLISNM